LTSPSRFASRLLAIIVLAAVASTTGCAFVGSQQDPLDPTSYPPDEINTISLNPQNWFWASAYGMPPHPALDSEGAWSFNFEMAPASIAQVRTGVYGAAGYLVVPFQATIPLHQVTITFEVESKDPQYVVTDPADHPPATLHLFFATRPFDFSGDDPNGRWWGSAPYFNNDGFNSLGYDLGSRDNQALVMSIPLTPDRWSNVYGQQNPQAFAAALKNVGFFGLTFGGQYFWGHGVGLSSGNAKFILINYVVN
jgi:hypothetical protein